MTAADTFWPFCSTSTALWFADHFGCGFLALKIVCGTGRAAHEGAGAWMLKLVWYLNNQFLVRSFL